MKGYRYDPVTKKYLGSMNLAKDPEGDGYLLPGDTTDVKPPSRNMYWNGAMWVKELAQE